jgi:hypothetical protein
MLQDHIIAHVLFEILKRNPLQIVSLSTNLLRLFDVWILDCFIQGGGFQEHGLFKLTQDNVLILHQIVQFFFFSFNLSFPFVQERIN